MEFPGIQQQVLWLLAENRFHNSKTFYEEHKPQFAKELIEPMHALFRDVLPEALQVDGELCQSPQKCLSRIRRDTRYTLDKSLYREQMWFIIRRPKNGYDPYPFYWFECGLQGYKYGCGIWGATPATMAAWRGGIDNSPAAFLKSVKPVLQGGYELDCERYKRPKKEGLPAKLDRWYQLKEVYASSPWLPVDGLQNPAAVIKQLAGCIRDLAPFYRLLDKVVHKELRDKAVPKAE